MLTFGHLIVVIVVCLVAARADAQTVPNTPRAFVDVPFGPNWDDARSELTRVPGATWESGLEFGFDAGRSGLEIDVDVPQWHVQNQAPQRYQYVGPSFEWEQHGHFYEQSSTERRRSIDVTVLHRTNVPVNRHVTFSWLVGGGVVHRPDQSTSVTNEVLPEGQLIVANTHETTSSRDYVAAAARLDVALSVAPHVSIVPRLRVTAFPSFTDDSGFAARLFTARPEIAVRWAF